MPLPAPDLDSRKFQDIVDDIKRQISLRCPEWSEHNVSDPGVTVLELFAYLFESALFRLNQVPERNYIKFLDLIGVELEMPHPATAELRFELSAAIPDKGPNPIGEPVFPARSTVATTGRTDSDGPLEFSLDVDLRLVRPSLSKVYSVPRMNDQLGDGEILSRAREFNHEAEVTKKNVGTEAELRAQSSNDFSDLPQGFTVFGNPEARPEEGDSLLLGFDGEVARNFIEIEVVQRYSGVGLDPEYPSQRWEYWDGSVWKELAIDLDETCGFDYDGAVRFVVPSDIHRRVMGKDRLFWIRCRYTLDLPDKVTQRYYPEAGLSEAEKIRPRVYERSPHLLGLKAATIGGQAPASNCILVKGEQLGRSDGKPGQAFRLLNAPVLKLEPGEKLMVGVVKDDPNDLEGWQQWDNVTNFADSGPDDRHFVLDATSGTIMFGPLISQPDGTPPKQYGAIPPFGHSIAITRYRLGGGPSGNVAANKITFLKSEASFVQRVYNPDPAVGGRSQEAMDRARLRALEILKVRNRAVTVEDYELLAKQATSGVGRAKCIQPTYFDGRISDTRLPEPGKVYVLIVPALSRGLAVPSADDLQASPRLLEEVETYLDERRLLTSTLEVTSPDFVFVSVHLKLLADPRLDFPRLRQRVVDALNEFIHPLYGWFDGKGWPFGRGLTLAEIYARIQQMPDGLIPSDARILKSEFVDPQRDRRLVAEQLAGPEDLSLKPYQVLCSRQHVVEILPLTNLRFDYAEARF